MRYLLTFTILSLALSAFGQGFQATDVAFMGQGNPPSGAAGPFSRTSIPGYPVNVQWLADSYVTNSGVVSIPSTAGNSYSITNPGSTRFPSKGPTLNGHKTIYFSTDSGQDAYLRSGTYTSTWPHTIFMVLSWTNIGSGPRIFDNINSGASRGLLYAITADVWGLYSSDGGICSKSVSNKWIVATAVFNGSSSYIMTNNVAGATVNCPADGMNGIYLACSGGTGNFAQYGFAEFIDYQAVLPSSTISNVYWDLTNTYGISP